MKTYGKDTSLLSNYVKNANWRGKNEKAGKQVKKLNHFDDWVQEIFVNSVDKCKIIKLWSGTLPEAGQ